MQKGRIPKINRSIHHGPSGWVFDVVTDNSGGVVASVFHRVEMGSSYPLECTFWVQDKLKEEGNYTGCSKDFQTEQEARQAFYKSYKTKFSKGLD